MKYTLQIVYNKDGKSFHVHRAATPELLYVYIRRKMHMLSEAVAAVRDEVDSGSITQSIVFD